jgi:hypothetical protein
MDMALVQHQQISCIDFEASGELVGFISCYTKEVYMYRNKITSSAFALKRTVQVGMCALALSAFASGAQAAVIFSDNFDGNALSLDAVPAGWAVTNGTVDIKGPGLFDLYPGNGAYIDLDGSANDAGELSQSFSLTGGVLYNASFTLGGSTRGDSNIVDVSFGSVTQAFTLASNDPLSLFNVGFTPASNGNFALTFANRGGDESGALLLDVAITDAVPEPETYALMLAGLGILVVVGKRRLGRNA